MVTTINNNKAVLLILSIFSISIGFAQNLVPNYSFEEYTELPDRLGQIEFAKGWYALNPKDNSPDYYHRRALPPYRSANTNNDVKVPKNGIGYQEPKSGDAYVGIYTWPVNEFISTKLLRPLIIGTKYKVVFFVSRCDLPPWATSQIGCYISPFEISLIDYYPKSNRNKRYNFTPQVESPSDIYIEEADDWWEISGHFTAIGGEQYLTIGCFLPPESNKIKKLKGDKNYPQIARYYIDDVSVYELDSLGNPILEASLVEISETTQTDTVAVPNKYDNITPGENFVLPNIVFEYGKSTLLPESYAELEKFAHFLLTQPNVKIELSGHTDNSGNEVENLKLSADRAKAVYDYLLSKGINESRMSYKGYGSSQPLVPNETETNKQKNRRVEVIIQKP